MSRCLVLASLAGLAGLAGLAACGDDELPDPVAFREVCGQRGPVRLLELPPGRQLTSNPVPLLVDDRRYFVTTEVVDLPSIGLTETNGEVWSTGPCGESPRKLATDPRWVSTRNNRWPGTVLACGKDSDAVVRLDPEGGPPTPFLPGVRCDDYWSEHGVIAIVGDEDDDPNTPETNAPFGALVLHPYPSDPLAPPSFPILLHPQIRLQPAFPDPSIGRSALLSLRPAEVMAIDADDQLLRFDLITGDVTVEASDVLAFRASFDSDRRYSLWQQLVPPAAVPSNTESAVILQDRETGTSIALGATALAYTYNALYYIDQGVLPLTLDGNRILRIFRLPELVAFDLPRRYTFEGVIDERHILVSSFRYDNLSIFDVDTEELRPLIIRQGDVFSFSPERALFMARDSYLELPRGPLYVLPLDGSEGHLGSAHATQYARLLGDHHLVTTIDPKPTGRSPLLLVDLDTADEQRIDTHVPAASFRLDAGFGPNHLVYSVDDGPRSGIYVAHLPASE